jgi:hypothetical protein
LDEEVEHLRQERGRDADARIDDADHCGAVIVADADVDPSAGRRVLGRIGDEVDEDLLEPRRVRDDAQRDPRQGQAELMPARVHDGKRDVHDPREDRPEVDALLLERDLAAAHARRFEQVVDEASHVHDLPLGHLARAVDHLRRLRRSSA